MPSEEARETAARILVRLRYKPAGANPINIIADEVDRAITDAIDARSGQSVEFKDLPA